MSEEDRPTTDRYDVILTEETLDDRQVWTATHPALPGCNAAAQESIDARIGLANAFAAWTDWAVQHNVRIPPPPEYPGLTVIYARREDHVETRDTAADKNIVEFAYS